MQREEPYLVLTSTEVFRDEMCLPGTVRQVLHGCRQLVVKCWLSPATSATLILCCQRSGRELKETAGDKLEEGGDDVKSSWPYDQGYTRATMAHKEKRPREQADLIKCVVVRIGVCNSTP